MTDETQPVTKDTRNTAYRNGLCIDCLTAKHSAGRPRCNQCHQKHEQPEAQIFVLPEPTQTRYADAAPNYWEAGWRGILPLPPRRKEPAPSGRTGHDGQDPSYADILQYCELYADGNLALRMPDTVIGIDVDAYSGKTGAATIAEAEKRWGTLPAGPRSSSRLENGDQTSGIRFFRIPAGTRLAGQIKFDELGIGHIEVIQNHHRYAVAWPSIHDKTGQTYWWYNGQWQHIEIPNIEDFPPLPDRWIEALQVTYNTNTVDLGETEANELIARCLTEGPITARVANKLGTGIYQLQNPDGSRHDAVLGTVLTMLRYGKDGDTGVKPALINYQQAFITALTKPGQRHAGAPEAAAAEFRRMIFNHNAARELSAPSKDEWVRELGPTPPPAPAPPPAAAVAPVAEATPAPAPVPDPVPETGTNLPAQPENMSDLDKYFENAVAGRMAEMRIGREAKRRLDEAENPVQQPPNIKPLVALLEEPDLPTPYRIESLAPAGGRTLLAAQYKAGKSSTVGNLIRSLVDGERFLDKFHIVNTSESLVLIDTELSENTIRLWLRQQGIRTTQAVKDVISLRGKLGTFNIMDDRTRTQWARRLSDVGCDYLILDCLRPALDANGLDEHSDVGVFLTAFDALLEEASIPDALMVHHMGHSGERSRGDSRLQDWPDAIWTIVRENENPASDRFFKAYGRDVDLGEGRLEFNPENRHLSYHPGSRGDTKVESSAIAVISLLAEANEGLSGRAIERELKPDGHPEKVIRKAVERLVERGVVRIDVGPRNSQLHRIANPCSECRLPVTNASSRHFECPQSVEGALEI